MASIHLHDTQTADQSPDERTWASAFGAAAVWHVGIACLLASVTYHVSSATNDSLDTRWSELMATELDELELEQTTVQLNPTTGGPVSQSLSAATFSEQVNIAPSPVAVSTQAQQPASTAPQNMGEYIPGYVTSGFGDGEGAGAPGGFFGTETEGKRFVFVVDQSLSMNHPHQSEARTRFRRLKLEMLKSIANMSDDMYFYIIFFSDGPTPMPAKSMQRASAESKERYLNWMARVPAGGQTDPRAALTMALKLRPDVVHFLTDGSFTNIVERQLRTLAQNRTVINTYAFGDPVGEKLMKWVARANGGEYTFIP